MCNINVPLWKKKIYVGLWELKEINNTTSKAKPGYNFTRSQLVNIPHLELIFERDNEQFLVEIFGWLPGDNIFPAGDYSVNTLYLSSTHIGLINDYFDFPYMTESYMSLPYIIMNILNKETCVIPSLEIIFNDIDVKELDKKQSNESKTLLRKFTTFLTKRYPKIKDYHIFDAHDNHNENGNCHPVVRWEEKEDCEITCTHAPYPCLWVMCECKALDYKGDYEMKNGRFLSLMSILHIYEKTDTNLTYLKKCPYCNRQLEVFFGSSRKKQNYMMTSSFVEMTEIKDETTFNVCMSMLKATNRYMNSKCRMPRNFYKIKNEKKIHYLSKSAIAVFESTNRNENSRRDRQTNNDEDSD